MVGFDPTSQRSLQTSPFFDLYLLSPIVENLAVIIHNIFIHVLNPHNIHIVSASFSCGK